MVAFVTRMPAGIPGAITRDSQPTIEPGLLNSAAAFAEYGVPGKLVSGKFQPLTASTDPVAGILVRPFPITDAGGALGTSTPPTSGVCDVMRRGYIAVKSVAGTAAKGGQVYITPAGKFSADATSNTALTGAKFTGAADAAGVVEIEFNI